MIRAGNRGLRTVSTDLTAPLMPFVNVEKQILNVIDKQACEAIYKVAIGGKWFTNMFW